MVAISGGSEGHPAAVSLQAVTRRYSSPAGPVTALDGVTLEIGVGTITAITGPSGSGKTTLLQLAAGLDRPTLGKVEVLGNDLASLSESKLTSFRASHIGLVLQEPYLLPGLSALDNVIIGGLTTGSWRSLEAEARQGLTDVGMASRIRFEPSRLSRGEQQRVAVARALVGARPILIADEPTGNLDVSNTDGLMELLVDLVGRRKITVLIATHDPGVASFASRVVRLVSGRLEEDHRFGDLTDLQQRELTDSP